MAYKHNQSLKPQLRKDVSKHLEVLTISLTGSLKLNLSRGRQTRTGVTYYEDEGVFSSADGGSEFPQEVTGTLRSSVGFKKKSDLKFVSGVGLNGDSGQSQEELENLAYGHGDASSGRYFMENTYENPETLQLARDDHEKVFK